MKMVQELWHYLLHPSLTVRSKQQWARCCHSQQSDIWKALNGSVERTDRLSPPIAAEQGPGQSPGLLTGPYTALQLNRHYWAPTVCKAVLTTWYSRGSNHRHGAHIQCILHWNGSSSCIILGLGGRKASYESEQIWKVKQMPTPEGF